MMQFDIKHQTSNTGDGSFCLPKKCDSDDGSLCRIYVALKLNFNFNFNLNFKAISP